MPSVSVTGNSQKAMLLFLRLHLPARFLHLFVPIRAKTLQAVLSHWWGEMESVSMEHISDVCDFGTWI